MCGLSNLECDLAQLDCGVANLGCGVAQCRAWCTLFTTF
jgi:hypothetical protein